MAISFVALSPLMVIRPTEPRSVGPEQLGRVELVVLQGVRAKPMPNARRLSKPWNSSGDIHNTPATSGDKCQQNDDVDIDSIADSCEIRTAPSVQGTGSLKSEAAARSDVSHSWPGYGKAQMLAKITRLRWMLVLAMLVGTVGVLLCFLWLDHPDETPYSLVEQGLFIGSSVAEPPPGTKAVVNLCGRLDPYKVEASLWEPIFEGGKDPDIEWLRRVVAFIESQRQANRTTYVHCMAGMNRSGAVVTAFLMHEHGWGRDQALSYLQRKRPAVQPNPTLMRLLADWENR